MSLRQGLVEPAPVLDLVRRFDVDVLAVQELTPHAEAALRTAGIDELLPHAHVLRPGQVSRGLRRGVEPAARRRPLAGARMLRAADRPARRGRRGPHRDDVR